MIKKIRFSDDCKDYDGCHEITKLCYEIINGFFNKPTIYHKRIGKSQKEIDEMLEDKETHHSFFIKDFVVSKKTGECDIILPIQTSEDCFDAVNGNMDVIYACIANLENALENIKEKKNESPVVVSDKFFSIEYDSEWEQTCTADVCYKKKCCLDKKASLKIIKKVSLVRSGGRDCNCTISIEHEFWVKKFLELLKNVSNKNKRKKLVHIFSSGIKV
jgi:hypothetical protein